MGNRQFCDEDLERLATDDPTLLLSLIEGGKLSPLDLTFAAEYAGKTPDSVAIRQTLTPLLSHDAPIVREGALYGLSPHLDDDITTRIRAMAQSDSSPGVRRAASALLEDI